MSSPKNPKICDETPSETESDTSQDERPPKKPKIIAEPVDKSEEVSDVSEDEEKITQQESKPLVKKDDDREISSVSSVSADIENPKPKPKQEVNEEISSVSSLSVDKKKAKPVEMAKPEPKQDNHEEINSVSGSSENEEHVKQAHKEEPETDQDEEEKRARPGADAMPEITFENPKIKKLDELLEKYKAKFLRPIPKHTAYDLRDFSEEGSLFCRNHPRRTRNLYLCLNVDCPLKVYCKICRKNHHHKACSRIEMDTELNQIDDKEELLEYFDVKNWPYDEHIRTVRRKFTDMRVSIEKYISEMEEIMIKKMKLQSKEFRLKQIFEEYERRLDARARGEGLVQETFDAAYEKFMFLQLVEIEDLQNRQDLLSEIDGFSSELRRNLDGVLERTIESNMAKTDADFVREKDFWEKKFNIEYFNKNMKESSTMSQFRIDYTAQEPPRPAVGLTSEMPPMEDNEAKMHRFEKAVGEDPRGDDGGGTGLDKEKAMTISPLSPSVDSNTKTGKEGPFVVNVEIPEPKIVASKKSILSIKASESGNEQPNEAEQRQEMLEKCTFFKICLEKNRFYFEEEELLFLFQKVFQGREVKVVTRYRMSKAKAFKMIKFNKNCGDEDNTVVFCKTAEGRVFGMVNHDPWDQISDESENNFIFSVDRKSIHKFKSDNEYDEEPFVYDDDNFISFGQRDLVIGDNCGKEESCSSELGRAYEFAGSDPKTYLTGREKFRLDEICVIKCDFF